MKDDLIIIAIICIFILYTLYPKKEGFFDTSGYNKPLNNIDQKSNRLLTGTYKIVSGITNDDVSEAVTATEKYLSKITGRCVYIIETNKIEKSMNERESVLYKCRFMVMVKDSGFPYAFGVDIEVLDGEVITALTQSFTSSSQAVVEEKEGNFEDIEKFYDSKIKDVFQ
jgi:hypothetical protein